MSTFLIRSDTSQSSNVEKTGTSVVYRIAENGQIKSLACGIELIRWSRGSGLQSHQSF